MKQRYRLIRRGERGEKFYCVDTLTGKRASLATPNRDEATQIVLAKNQALRQPALNLQIAKAYLAGSDSGVATRTWQQAMEALVATKLNANQVRWKTAIKDRAFDSIRQRVIIETQAEQLLGRAAGRHRQHERLLAQAPQLRPRYGLAALADIAQEALADRAFQGEAGHHLRGACPHPCR